MVLIGFLFMLNAIWVARASSSKTNYIIIDGVFTLILWVFIGLIILFSTALLINIFRYLYELATLPAWYRERYKKE